MKPRILCYDLETSPLITYTWKTWQADAIEVIEDTQILCFAYKWIGERKTYVIGQDDFKDYKPGINNDKNVVKALWKLFDEADVIVGQNSDQFDNKKSNSRFIQNGLTPPSPYIQLDTKKIAKRYFGFTSNRLGDLAKYLGVEDKADPGGFATWKGCLAGNKKAWKQMKKYNIQDVKTTEQIYLKLRAWDKNGAPMNVLNGDFDACPRCGENKGFHINYKYRHNKTGNMYQYLKCKACRGSVQKRVPEDSFRKVTYV
jgi:hypothetical protein